MDRLEQLLNEAKPLYFKRKRNRRVTAALCALTPCLVAVFLSFHTQVAQQGPIYDIWMEEIDWAENGSVIQDMGLPVDEYGLLKVI